MSSIQKTIQILTIGAGSENPKVLFELQTSDSPVKRIIVARTSQIDTNVYFQDHAALKALGVFPNDDVINLFEDEWPVDLTPQLTQDGALPSGMNASFATANFGTGKTGIIAYNGFDRVTGSYSPVTKTVAASAPADPAAPAKWYQNATVKFAGYVALAAGAIVGLIYMLRKK